jgi:hypothetical protein
MRHVDNSHSRKNERVSPPRLVALSGRQQTRYRFFYLFRFSILFITIFNNLFHYAIFLSLCGLVILVEDLLRISERDSTHKGYTGYPTENEKTTDTKMGIEDVEEFLEMIWRETSPIRSYAKLLLFVKK